MNNIYNKNKIEPLLHKFMEGLTSIEEEEALGAYFRSEENIPQEWEAYKKMFGYFDDGMPNRVSEEIIVPKQKKDRLWMKIAATVVLVVSVATTFIIYNRGIEREKETVAITESIRKQVKQEIKVDKPLIIDVQPKATENIKKTAKVAQKVKEQKIKEKDCKPTLKNVKSVEVDEEFLSNYELSEETKRIIAQNIAEIQQEAEYAKTELCIARAGAMGYVPITNEDGSIEYKKENVESINVIEL